MSYVPKEKRKDHQNKKDRRIFFPCDIIKSNIRNGVHKVSSGGGGGGG